MTGCRSSACRVQLAAVPNFLSLVTLPEFRGRRILMIDYVGSGFSGHSESFGFSLDEHASSIAAVLDAACIEPVHLLGYSMGGAVAVSVALLRLISFRGSSSAKEI